MNDMIMALPEEAADTVSDFIRAFMVLGWDSTRHLLGKVMDYISLVKASQILAVDANTKIKPLEQEIQTELDRLVFNYTDAKYRDDPLYQKWVKGRK